jgi:hypothetical protein
LVVSEVKIKIESIKSFRLKNKPKSHFDEIKISLYILQIFHKPH